MDNKGNYLTFKTFKQIFPYVRTIFFMYRAITGAIKKYQHQTKVELVADYKVQAPKMCLYIQTG